MNSRIRRRLGSSCVLMPARCSSLLCTKVDAYGESSRVVSVTPQRSQERAQVADEAEALDGVVPVAEAAHPRSLLAPVGTPRLAGQQTRNQIPGDEHVRLPPQIARDVVERHHLDPAAHVLQRPRDLGEVPVARGEQHAVDVAGLQKHVDGHVQVAVGFAEPLAVLVDVPLDVLDDDLVAEVAQRRLEALDVALVVLVRLGALAVERRIRIQPQRVRSVAAGELPQHVVPQTPAPVPRDVVRIDVDTDSHSASVPFPATPGASHFSIRGPAGGSGFPVPSRVAPGRRR